MQSNLATSVFAATVPYARRSIRRDGQSALSGGIAGICLLHEDRTDAASESGRHGGRDGCGRGLNLGVLAEQVGPCGTIIGVYLTVEMLDKARERVHRHAWTNVALVEYDAAEYRLSHGVDDIRSTYVITLVPEYDLVIQEGAAASLPPKRLVILDFKKPEHWPNWLIRLFAAITRPFWRFPRSGATTPAGSGGPVSDRGSVPGTLFWGDVSMRGRGGLSQSFGQPRDRIWKK
jgi:hypothetical protein